jgi:hypothetical protein
MCVVATVTSDAGTATTANVCQDPTEVHCVYNSDCKAPLVCGRDETCRNQCAGDVDCATNEKCTVSGVCATPAQINPATGDVPLVTTGRTADGGLYSGSAGASGAAGAAGATGATGAAGATSAGGISGTSGSGGKAAGGAAGGSSCSGPELDFPSVAQGDTNPHFNSAVAARSADTLFIFTSYQGPATSPDGGADAGIIGNALFVQAFDPVTGDKHGAATNLAMVTGGTNFQLYDSAIAPTGEIALLYGVGLAENGGSNTQLYALFLSIVQGDGGVGELKVGRSVQIESVDAGDAHVIWATHDGAFAFQWKYRGSGGYWFTKIQRYQTNGISAGGGIGTVPTSTGSNYSPSDGDDCYLGASGNYLAVAFRPNGNTGPVFQNTGELVILDDQGFQVGTSYVSVSNETGISNWIAVGGTTQGFVSMYQVGGGINGAFVPLSGAGDVIVDGGIGKIGGDGGLPALKTYSFPSTAGTGKLISDDAGGAGGVGMALLENDGATFFYISADGSKPYNEGTVISDGSAGQVNISNYQGSFVVSIFDTATHGGKAVASSCQ